LRVKLNCIICCRWTATGTLWLTDVRLVFIAPTITDDGLHAFDFPLAYITHDKFNQPIFGCNNLAGGVSDATPPATGT